MNEILRSCCLIYLLFSLFFNWSYCRYFNVISNLGKLQMNAYTYPTACATGSVEYLDIKTWHANLWSSGCFVMNPKYLKEKRFLWTLALFTVYSSLQNWFNCSTVKWWRRFLIFCKVPQRNSFSEKIEEAWSVKGLGILNYRGGVPQKTVPRLI